MVHLVLHSFLKGSLLFFVVACRQSVHVETGMAKDMLGISTAMTLLRLTTHILRTRTTRSELNQNTIVNQPGSETDQSHEHQTQRKKGTLKEQEPS